MWVGIPHPFGPEQKDGQRKEEVAPPCLTDSAGTAIFPALALLVADLALGLDDAASPPGFPACWQQMMVLLKLHNL